MLKALKTVIYWVCTLGQEYSGIKGKNNMNISMKAYTIYLNNTENLEAMTTEIRQKTA